jgi:glycosyltransferase involved in cell wall biosynthesis
MATSGVKVLVIGKRVPLPPQYEAVYMDRLHNLFGTLATFQPDVIVSSDFIPGALNGSAYSIRRRWIHVDPNADEKAVTAAVENAYAFSVYGKGEFDKFNPLISVYTPTYNTGDYLRETYQSLQDQTYKNWEWVVVDDCSTDGTWEKLLQYAKEDLRVRPYQSARPMRRIGLAKNTATALCYGQYLVELDHDDMLTDFALDEIKKAFESDPEVGFVYSNCANFFENGTFHRFDGPDWKNQYRETEYRGKKWLECINHDIYARFGPHFTQQFGWFLTVGPNHVRAYRADQFRKLGGYNPNLPVADDWDLYARFFLFSKCLHVDKMLYLYRFSDNWTNTTFVKNQAIQDNLAIGRGHYAQEFEKFNAKRLEKDQFLKGITKELVQDAERVKLAKEIAEKLEPVVHSDFESYKKAQLETFKSHEDESPRWKEGQIRFVQKTFKETSRDLRILDIACGAGCGLGAFREMGFTAVEGFEWDAEKAKRAEKHGYPVHVGDMHDLSRFKDESFDVVYSSHTLEHAFDASKVLSEFRRILKPSGQLVLVLPYPDPGEENIKAHCAKYALGTHLHDGAATLSAVLFSEGFGHIQRDFDSFREPEVWIHAEKSAGTVGCPVGEKGEAGVPGVPESGHNGRSSGDISFVVPEAVPSELTVKCLKSIREYAPGSEIILVANGCEPLPEACKLADKVVRLEMNLRFAAGCNRGAMEATRELICIMNNDAEFVDSSPARLAQAVTKDHPIVAPFSNRAKPPQGDLERMQVPGEHLYPDMVVGVCMVMPAELFRMLGGFDPRLDTYEDDDICYRARSHGFGCKIVGGTYVLHERHATFKALKEDVQAIMVRNGEIFGKKHPKIKVLAIAKNEANSLKDYFEQFAFVTRDWCLLDTGSTDDTITIAKSIGVRVESGTPISPDHGFADARNEALDRFGKDADWIIMIDPDERLDAHTIRNIKETVFRTPFDIFLSPLRAVSPNGETRQFVPKPFLFRSKPEIRWVFKVHEKLIGHKQAIVKNAMIDHVLVLHEDGRRSQASGLYDLLAKKEPYFTDPEYKKQILSKWPILDYDRMDDLRISKLVMGPLISVVIPTFKRHELLKRAVRSVLTQDYANLELVVVGDCDPDFKANKKALDGDPRIRSFDLPKNHGAGGAEPRNHAIMLSAGKFIAYLDDDNEWTANHVSSVYEAMREKVAAFGFSSMWVDGADLLFKKPEFQGIDTSCVIHRRELISKYGWWKDRTEANYHHDWEFFSRWVAGGEKWACTRKPTLIYNAESSGQTAFIKALAEKRANGEKAEPPKPDLLTEKILDAEKKVEAMVAEANKGKEATRLTIAVPAIASRFNTTLPKVLGALFEQAQGKPVEVKVMLDNKKATLSEKRNQAIAHARGGFIAFVDDDDRVEPDYIDKLLEAIRANPDADCIVFDVMVHGYSPEPKLCKYGTEFQEGNGAEAYFRKPNHVMAYRVELAQKYKFVNAYMEEDLVWSRQASRDIKKQIRIEKVLYHYLFDPKTTQQGAVREVLFSR